MNKHIFLSGLLLTAMTLGVLSSCDTETEALVIQDYTTYDEQYYQNLRDFKKSQHEISYVYYAAWAPLEGSTEAKDPASWGERIVGLPDSLDIVNLWMGIPTPEAHPVAYQDMLQVQKNQGTRFVMHADAANYNHTFWYRDENFVVDQSRQISLAADRSEENLRAYARWAVDTLVACGLDGVDFDYEGWDETSITIVANECNKYFGPEGKWPEKLFIIDYFSVQPPLACNQYTDYFIKQAYSKQGAGTGAGTLPNEKVVYCESFGHYPTGGQILNYAAWEPGNGEHKGGCGAYYVDNNYYQTTDGIPYSAIRGAIQIMNPAVTK